MKIKNRDTLFIKKKIQLTLFLLLLILSACKKEEVNSETSANPTQEEFSKKVLVEKISSVNCGSCPLAQYELNQLNQEFGDDLVYVSHYLFGALNHGHTQYLLSKIDKTYFTPLSLINRKENGEGTVFFQLYAWKDEIAAGLSSTPEVGIALNSVYENERVELEVEIMTSNNELEDARLHVYLLEKSVTGEGPDYDQKNYGHDDPESPYYNQGEFIEDFEHKNILRDRVTSPDGELISWQDARDKFSFNFDFQLADSKSMADYLVVAFVATGEVPYAGLIKNVQFVGLGDSASMYE